MMLENFFILHTAPQTEPYGFKAALKIIEQKSFKWSYFHTQQQH